MQVQTGPIHFLKCFKNCLNFAHTTKSNFVFLCSDFGIGCQADVMKFMSLKGISPPALATFKMLIH